MRDNNISLVVETPFATFNSMYVQSISFTQGNEKVFQKLLILEIKLFLY